MTTTNAELIAEARAIVRAVGDGSSFDGRPAWLVIQDLADALESATTVTDEMGRWEYRCTNALNTSPCAPGHNCGGKVERRFVGHWTAALTEGERR